jgi:hypothetical protein
MLPANQSTHAPHRRRHCFQPTAVTIAPDEAFGVGRHKFPVMVFELSVLGNTEKRVVERSVSGTGINSLTRSHHNRNFEISRRFAERIHLFAGDRDAVISQLRENVFRAFALSVRRRISMSASRQKSAPHQYVLPQVCVRSSPRSPA